MLLVAVSTDAKPHLLVRRWTPALRDDGSAVDALENVMPAAHDCFSIVMSTPSTM